MKRKCGVEEVYQIMTGFATKEEIDEEIAELIGEGYTLEDAIKTVIANIDHWAKWDNDEACVVWDRMAYLGITVDTSYCTKNS